MVRAKFHKLLDLYGIKGISSGSTFLDIGAGDGAFVQQCRDRGLDAWGSEAEYAPEFAADFIYARPFEDILFPTDHFDYVVAREALGHSLDPPRMVKEAFRVLAQGGTCVMEMPEQFGGLLEGVGFDAIRIVRKGHVNAIFSATKPPQKRVKLLLPPGVGDVYWPLVKTQALLRREGIVPPVDAYVVAPRAKKYGSESRSFPFLKMFPFLHSADEVRFSRDPIWRKTYLNQGQTVIRDVLDCDYFITWNGYLRAGKTLAEVDPDLECNWRLPRFVSLKEEGCRKYSRAVYGDDYMVLYWAFAGTNRQILRHFGLKEIADCIRRIADETSLRPVLVGAVWDLDCQYLEQLRQMLPENIVDLRGQTDIEEIFGIMRGAKVVFGMNSGITIMAAAFGVPTVMLIHEYLFSRGVHRDFALNTVPPDTCGKTYFPEYADRVTPDGLVERVVSVANGTPMPVPKAGGIRARKTHQVPSDLAGSPVASIRDLDELENTVFVCVLRSGGDFNADYVIRLRNMVARHLPGQPRFVCLTDLPEIDGIETIPLITTWSGWWAKLELFREGLFDGASRAIYFDLDTLIVGDISPLLALNGDFYGLRPWNRANREKGQAASGAMVWSPGDYGFIFDEFDMSMADGQTDQSYISATLRRHKLFWEPLQDSCPGIYSYKRECQGQLPRDARIICFHGRPRVHECGVRWVKEVWQ